MSTLPKSFITPEEYLEIERKAEFRSEYCRGEMFAVAGATEVHTLLVGNTWTALLQRLRRGSCRVYAHDMKVRVSASGLYTYPDLVVGCAERKFLDERHDTLLNPVLIVEVLSDSTEAYDRGEKFRQYRTLESLQEYVLIAQDRVQAEVFRRQPDGQWLLRAVSRLEDSITLESVGCSLLLSDIYEDVEIPAESRRGA